MSFYHVTKMSLDTTISLAIQVPEEFDPWDEEECKLISEGAYELVLIEEATELFRRAIFDHDLIVPLLRKISRGKQVDILPPEIFPPHEQSKEFENAVTTYKKKIINFQRPLRIAVLALQGDGFEHFAAFFFKQGQVKVFDAMQQYDKSIKKFTSHYSSFFKNLAKRIFDTNNVEIEQCFDLPQQFSLQLTGGTTSIQDSISLQSTESQNHFCYLWAIWYLHLQLLEKDFTTILIHIAENNIDPLVVIKRYGYTLLQATNLMNKIPKKYRNFFHHHFPTIWSNGKQSKLNFKREAIGYRKVGSMDECLSYSY